MDAAHALLKPHQGPWDVVVDQHVRGLEVDAFIACVCGDDGLKIAAHERFPNFIAVWFGLPTGVHPCGEPLANETLGDPFRGVGVFGEYHHLLAAAGSDAVGGETVVYEALPFRRNPFRVGDGCFDPCDELLDRGALGTR